MIPTRSSSGVRWPLLVALAALSLTQPAVAEETEGRLAWEVSAGPTFFDNFFEAPDGSPKESVTAGIIALELSAVLGKGPGTLRLGVRDTEYNQDLENSQRVAVGFSLGSRPQGLDLALAHEVDRPSFTVGDEFDRADVTTLQAEYSYRIGHDWQVSVLGDAGRESFDRSPLKDSDLFSFGGALRYRGWGSSLSPEVGVLWGERSVDDPDEEYDEQEIFIKLRSSPVPSLYLSLRYRLRDRDYSIGDPLADNFGRQDDRRQWALTGVYSLNRRLGFNLYATAQDADSTKPSRVFTNTMVSTWLSFHF